jgi:hypothetical protein
VKSRDYLFFSSTESKLNSTQKSCYFKQSILSLVTSLCTSITSPPRQAPEIVRIVLDLGENLLQQCFTWCIAQNLSDVGKIQSLPNLDNPSFTSSAALQLCTFSHYFSVWCIFDQQHCSGLHHCQNPSIITTSFD